MWQHANGTCISFLMAAKRFEVMRNTCGQRPSPEGMMRVVVSKWRSIALIRTQASVMAAARANLDGRVHPDIREENGRIVIEPIRAGRFDLEQLVAGITEENLHNEVDFGKGVGQETL